MMLNLKDLWKKDFLYRYKLSIGEKVSNKEFIRLELDDSTSELLNVVSAVIKDKDGKRLLINDLRYGWWFNAGGKVDPGETPRQAVYREVKEELGVDVISDIPLGTFKLIHNGRPILMHYFELQISGEPRIVETDKHCSIKWFEFLPFDNSLGFCVRIENNIIEDEYDILVNYTDYHLVKNVLEKVDNKQLLIDGKMELILPITFPISKFENIGELIDENSTYITYFDKQFGKYIVTHESFQLETNDLILVFKQKGKDLKKLKFKDNNIPFGLADFSTFYDNIEKAKLILDGANFTPTQSHIYFIRHGEAEGQEIDSDLTEQGVQAFNDLDFISSVLRLNIDHIFSSPVKRAYITAQKIQEIINDNIGKHIDISIHDNLGLSVFRLNTGIDSRDIYGENLIDLYEQIVEDSSGKNILIVAHRETFNPLWRYLYNPSGDILLGEVKQKLVNLEIVKLPSYRITNRIDKEVLSALYNFIDSEYLLKEGKVEEFIGNLVQFNNYFGEYLINIKSMVDSLDESSKISLYSTLYEVTYLYQSILKIFFDSEFSNLNNKFPIKVYKYNLS